MRIVLLVSLFAVAFVLAPRTVEAGAPSIPNVTTSGNWTPAPPVAVVIPAPPQQTPQYIPFTTSQPYANFLPCIGDTITGFALDYCGTILAVNSGYVNSTPGIPGSSTSGSSCVPSFGTGSCTTLCADGTISPSIGSGTCSDHGGEAALHGPTGP